MLGKVSPWADHAARQTRKASVSCLIGFIVSGTIRMVGELFLGERPSCRSFFIL